MPTTAIMVKHLGALRPAFDADAEVLARVKEGAELKVTWTVPRNIQFHNKFFAMLGIILANQEHYTSTQELLAVCKLRIGHVNAIKTPQGIERWPASISFAKMDETAFAAFYNQAVDWMLTEVIPGLQRQHLDGEVEAELLRFAA